MVKIVDFISLLFLLIYSTDYRGEFQWDKYLLETKSTFAPRDLFQVIKVKKKTFFVDRRFSFLFSLGKSNESI